MSLAGMVVVLGMDVGWHGFPGGNGSFEQRYNVTSTAVQRQALESPYLDTVTLCGRDSCAAIAKTAWRSHSPPVGADLDKLDGRTTA